MTALPFSPPTALAPLEGVGRPAMLRAWARVGGMGLLCAPFIRISQAPPSQRRFDSLTLRHGPMIHSTQLLGTDPELMAVAAQRLEETGVDIIDLNFGCPSKMVTKKGGGAAMMRDPRQMAAVVAAVRAAVSVPVLAKIRLGLTDPADGPGLARTVANAGATMVAVHARTLEDRYRGPARWEWLARCVDAVDVPVIGNGDVWTAADAGRMRRETGCAGVMVGRPALRNPWIFRQIEAMEASEPVPWPSSQEVGQFLLGVADDLERDAPVRRAVLGRVKEVCAHVGALLDDGGAWRSNTLRTPDRDALWAALTRLAEGPGIPLAKGTPTTKGPSPP